MQVDLLALHRAHPARYPHLLESVLKGTPQARYDLLFAFPGERLLLQADGRLQGTASARGAAGPRFTDALDAWFEQEGEVRGAGEGLPFIGGWFVYLAYELAAEVEPSLRLAPDPMGLPVAMAERMPAALVRDHATGGLAFVVEPGHEHLLEQVRADLAGLSAHALGPVQVDALEEDPPARYLQGVERIKRYIREGDVFQVNLSRAWRARIRTGLSHADLYAALRAANPAPFAALATWGEAAIVSSSPERLVSVRGREVSTRPIAGTRPRGERVESDAGLSRELLSHPKERAEHVMLIDLERNDLGRVCVPGTVRVDELMVLESYRHVHHIVSNVRGTLRPEITPGAVIRAVFPGGTITGCPKVRCMEIVAELEQEGRGAYTGAVGYLSRNGDLDLNILIRTLVRRGERLGFRTGAGIVADSDPRAELDETRHKAEGLLRALR